MDGMEKILGLRINTHFYLGNINSNGEYVYSQTCIQWSPLGQRKQLPGKISDSLFKIGQSRLSGQVHNDSHITEGQLFFIRM